MGDPHGLGIVGLGVISAAYLETLARHPGIRIAAVADLDQSRAEAVADAVPGSRAATVDDLLADPAVETVLNLTVPAAHADIAMRAIRAGKNVYGEKPLTATFAEAIELIRLAESTGRRIGCAPDTVLGTGLQTARRAVDAGAIGRPVSAVATWVASGHEAWHPHPDFYYLDGGGPLMDMGPYYITALVQLLGPVVSVVGAGSRTRSTRVIASGPRAGEEIPVGVDTHVTGILQHAGGAISTIVVSFDGVASEANPIEVHGEEGSLVVPDPNGFGGDVRIRRLGHPDFESLPHSGGYEEARRGVGLIDFISARPGHGRASGALALHVLEVMTAILASTEQGRVELTTTVTRPEPVPLTPADAWQASAAPVR